MKIWNKNNKQGFALSAPRQDDENDEEIARPHVLYLMDDAGVKLSSES